MEGYQLLISSRYISALKCAQYELERSAGEFLAKSGVWHRDDVEEVCKTDQLSSGLKMQELFEENIGTG